MTDDHTRKQLVAYLKEGNAHATLREAVAGVPAADRCREVGDLPYTLWDLLEHIRIAQWDIVEFCTNSDHTSPAFPDGYWPEKRADVSQEEWKASLGRIQRDRDRMIDLIQDPECTLTEPLSHGSGQTLLKEVQVLIDHRSYHTGQIIVLRRLLGNWSDESPSVSM